MPARLPACRLLLCSGLALACLPGCASLRQKIVPDSVAACRDFQREGVAALERGDDERAHEMLVKAVSASPTDVDARRQLAEVLWEEGRPNEAIEQIEAAVELEPTHGPTVVRAGEMLLAAGQIDQAQPFAQRGLALDHTSPGAWALRGRIYRRQGNAERALADLQRALQYAPDSRDILFDVSELHYQLGRPQRCLTTLHYLLDRYPRGEQPQRALWLEGLAYQSVDRPREAAASLLAASTRGEPHPELLYQLAKVEAALGRPAAATSAVRQALALDSEHAESRALLASLMGPSVGGKTILR